jgi:DNA-directed RNA polymerase specialized sigma24 family protein
MDAADVELYEKHSEELIHFATFLVGPSDASDLVIAAVVRVAGTQAWRSARDPLAYLRRAVLNEARMTVRANRRRHKYEMLSTSMASSTQPDDWDGGDVLDAVDRLSPRQRAVIYLTTIYCTVPGHRAAGEQATINVTRPS